jgi:hypothetical protein
LKLAEIQEAMHRMLRGQAGAEETAALLGADARRLGLYRDFVADHVTSALADNFVYTRALLGPAWDGLAADYFHSRAPRHWELNTSGEEFADYLEARRAAGHPALQPFHVVVAQFEWEEWLAYAHEARIPAPAELSAPALNPTLAVLEAPYALIDFLAAHKRELSPALALPPLLPAPQTTLVFRHPVELIAHAVVADPPLLLAMKMAASAVSVAEAAAATGQSAAVIAAALAGAAARGVIILPENQEGT